MYHSKGSIAPLFAVLGAFLLKTGKILFFVGSFLFFIAWKIIVHFMGIALNSANFIVFGSRNKRDRW
jgi:mannose/fructose/N-acetylgalactosamine-specific phosphotransferase system component IID